MKDDGWPYTGDVGVMHPEGYMEIKDGSKGCDYLRRGECVQSRSGLGIVLAPGGR